ncbi:MAG TPA: mandelate racemase/muconate lactonizing enzyme family protein, partial [Hyphomicrobiales bacterium]|nr:mandelate racemase/muconate lactonizing enzyme family protein [Hyphomicrobiales bacterium]
RLMGQDAMSHEAIVEQLYWALTDRGQTGNAIQAISAVDCALWDLKGKRYGEPVWRLLGGANREVGGYATCGMNYMSRDELTYVASELVKSGCNRLKMVVADGLPGRLRNEDIEAVLAEDAARVRALREGAGPEALIFIDANHHLDEWHAIRFARMIADYDVAIFEEPLRANDIRRLADLRREIAIPIGAGQNEGHISRWRDMVVNDAVDVLHYNVCIGGGYTTGLKVAALGQAFGVPIDNGGGFSHFNVQLHGGVANGGLCEWHMNVVPFSRILYNGIPELQGNKFILSETPGVGFELNREALQEFTVG